MKNSVTLYVDGASRGNPGPAALGFCVLDAEGKTIVEQGECLGIQTNNYAEYRALERGLQECLLLQVRQVQVYTDSQLLAHQFNGIYRIKHTESKDSMVRIKELCRRIGQVQVSHILRSTHQGNVRADHLANVALDQQAQNRVKPARANSNKIFVQGDLF